MARAYWFHYGNDNLAAQPLVDPEIRNDPAVYPTPQVRARLFLREKVATLGVAPLTSMFFFGENQPHRTDFRPEVHDSDGLMVATGDGEWIWRPLLNPKQTLTTSFSMQKLRGFGLMQRDREQHRIDLRIEVDVARHHRRRLPGLAKQSEVLSHCFAHELFGLSTGVSLRHDTRQIW